MWMHKYFFFFIVTLSGYVTVCILDVSSPFFHYACAPHNTQEWCLLGSQDFISCLYLLDALDVVMCNHKITVWCRSFKQIESSENVSP
jgi:hypothetical protein